MSLFRPAVEKMKGYVPGFQPKGLGFIKLNTNENPYPPSEKVLNALKEAVNARVRLYPDPVADELRMELAKAFRFPKDWIMVGNGSDEILNLAMRAGVEKNDKVLITEPTYILYEVLAQMQEAKIIRLELDEDFNLPKQVDTRGIKMTFISNPNAPTGALFGREQLRKICRASKGIVLIDEAYADFAKENCLDFVREFKNVIVTRTLSKSYSLAGLRIGFAIARPQVIETLMKLKDSYNVNRLSQVAGIAAIRDRGVMKRTVQQIIRDREFLIQHLERLDFSVIPSQTNFIFVKHARYDAFKLLKELERKKILVRFFNRPRLKEYLRISIGRNQEMIKLVRELERILK
ncbi:MAG: histidinol-phosphate transaminase [Chlamydiae bacterium]|nr:histidinol-phosphate transaminase [Chlamydiota bacterium]MBI3265995.1 histidinol-phosphate transaminase [Chlamydiota bacterium]